MTYNRAMLSVERPSRAVNESRALEGVSGGIRESWCRAWGLTKREPFLATLRGDWSHPCRAERYKYDREESFGCGIHGGLLEEPTTNKENEKPIGAHCLQRWGSRGNNLATRWCVSDNGPDKRLIGEKGDGRPGKRSRCNVSGPIQRAQIKGLGFDEIWFPVSLFWREGGNSLRSNFPSRKYGR